MHLSRIERVILRGDKNYDPELDRKAKIDELRSPYERLSIDIDTEQEELGTGL